MKALKRIFLVSLFCLSLITFSLISNAMTGNSQNTLALNPEQRTLAIVLGIVAATLSVLTLGVVKISNHSFSIEAGTRSRCQFGGSDDERNRLVNRKILVYLGVATAIFALVFFSVAISLWLFFIILGGTLLIAIYRSWQRLNQYSNSQGMQVTLLIAIAIFYLLTLCLFSLLIPWFVTFPMTASCLFSLPLVALATPFLSQQFGLKLTYQDALTKVPMQELDEQTLASHLTKAEKLAKQFGSVYFRGWIPNQASDPSQVHIRAYVHVPQKAEMCSHCQELTVVRHEKVIKPATYTERGTLVITKVCLCCEDLHETKATISKRSRSSRSSSSSVSTNYGGYYSGGSCGGSSSGDGGGSSFSGGDSGGGGAGGSF